MQAKQYEERILKLQDALEMQKLKNLSQIGRIRTLEEQLDKTQIALEEEREEKETILKNRRTNRLLMELKEERVQRLQDLQEIYAKDKQLELLATGMSTVTQGVKGVQDELVHKDAEVTGLRATVRCSAKLLQNAEKDFITTHRELEETQIKLMDCRRKLAERDKEVRVWIERYEQVMMDLHASQFRLVQLARGDASAKDAALARGYAVDLEHDRHNSDSRDRSTGVTAIRPRSFPTMKDVGASDRAVRKYRQDLIPNRSQQVTASINQLHAVSVLQPRSVRHSRSTGSLAVPSGIGTTTSISAAPHPHELHACASRECFQCTHGNAPLPLKTKASSSRQGATSYDKCEVARIADDAPELQSGSKYLGYGLGLLKKHHAVPSKQL